MDDNNYNPQPPQQPYYGAPEPQQTPGISIASMVCGILSLLIPYVNLILGILAIIFGIMGRNQAPSKSGMATAGLVMGIIGVAYSLIIFCVCGSICTAFI